MEQKLEAAQETIVDQQQTIEKFRDLVRNLNADLKDLRSSKVERGGSAEKLESNESKASVTSLTAQLKSAVKAQARVRLAFDRKLLIVCQWLHWLGSLQDS